MEDDYLEWIECWNFKTCQNYVLENQEDHFFCDECLDQLTNTE